MFYIYEWYNIDTNEVFYVGKGVYNRYRVKKRNKLFNEYIKTHKCDVRIIEYYNDELMCFKREEELIDNYKKIGQCQCNCVFGGCGGVKTYWTKEMKEKMSKENPMKAQEQRERMSVNNPMKNPEVARKVGEKHSKPFYIGNVKYNNLREASEFYKIKQTSIAYWLKKGVSPFGEKCYHIIKKEIKPKIINKEECYIIFRNKRFKSIREIAEKEHLNHYTLGRWLKNGFSSTGEYIRYSNDKKEYKYVKPNKTHTNKPIKVNGKIYNSILDASKDLKVSYETMRKYLKYGANDKSKYKNIICEYVNQQPSTSLNDL